MNLGLPEMLVIFAVALLLFGPKRLPELAKNLGKGIRDFKKAVAGEEDKNEPPQQVSGHNPNPNQHIPDKAKDDEKV